MSRIPVTVYYGVGSYEHGPKIEPPVEQQLSAESINHAIAAVASLVASGGITAFKIDNHRFERRASTNPINLYPYSNIYDFIE